MHMYCTSRLYNIFGYSCLSQSLLVPLQMDMNPNYLGLLLPKMLCELVLFVDLIVDGTFNLVRCFPKKV